MSAIQLLTNQCKLHGYQNTRTQLSLCENYGNNCVLSVAVFVELTPVKEIAYACAITAAHREFLAIDEMNHEIASRFAAHFLYITKVHDSRTVNAKEQFGVKALFKGGHGFAQKMSFASRADAHIVLFGTDPSDIRDRKEEDATAGFEDDAARVWSGFGFFRVITIRMSVPSLNLFPRPIDCGVQALSRKGF